MTMMDNDGQWCNSAKPTLLCIRQAVMTGNRSYNIIQYTKGRKHYGRNVPAAQLEAYRTATENHRRFMALVDEYVELMSERTAREIAKEVGNGRKAGK